MLSVVFICLKFNCFGWVMGDGSGMFEYATQLPGYHIQIQLDYLLKLEAKLMDE